MNDNTLATLDAKNEAARAFDRALGVTMQQALDANEPVSASELLARATTLALKEVTR